METSDSMENRTREPRNGRLRPWGSKHLKTIVPMSGTTALHPLLYKNGSAEARSQIMHMNYFSSTVDYDQDDLDNICPDIIEGYSLDPDIRRRGDGSIHAELL